MEVVQKKNGVQLVLANSRAFHSLLMYCCVYQNKIQVPIFEKKAPRCDDLSPVKRGSSCGCSSHRTKKVVETP